ncbi:MAG TPA: hypothetical protein DDY77_05230 [Clostridiales bacterium]|nr:hypothetical protein [Clostridiales bacterium]
MINSKFLFDKVNEYYSKKAAERSFSAFLSEDELSNVKGYNEAKYAYKAAVYDKEKALYLGDEKTAAKKQAEAEELKKTLDKITSSIPEKKPVYECEICKDTGKTDNGYCKCFKDRLLTEAYGFLDVKRPTLKSFKEDTLSSVNKTELLKSKLIKYADEFSDGKKNLILFGPAGTGKSFYAQCVTERLEKNGFTPLFLTAFELNDIATGAFEKSPAEKIITDEILSTCDLLVIDDLGSEPIYNKITVENLLEIISRRTKENKPILITTNLTTEEILTKYGERVFSRITGKNTAILQLNGKDLRKQ